MRRRDVPCSPCGSGSSSGCGCCSLKEKLAVLWDRTIGSILKINNVTPDGDGKFEIKAGSNVTISEISNGIEISATGGSAEDAVKSVNGELPDQNGDVTIDTGVMTVNGVSPDADGEVTITAGSNITITPDAETNSIEISASGGDKQWTLYNDKDWSVFVSNGVTTEDLYIYISGLLGNTVLSGETFIPKGTLVNSATPNVDIQQSRSDGGGPRITIGNIPAQNYLSSGTTCYYTTSYINTVKNGSGADEVINVNYESPSTSQMAKIISESDTNLGVRLYRRV